MKLSLIARMGSFGRVCRPKLRLRFAKVPKENDFWLSAIAVGLLIPAWFLGHYFTNFIADPIEVMAALPAFVSDPATWYHVGVTTARVALGLLGGVIVGTAAAFIMHRSPLLNEALSTYVTIGLRTPSAVAAIVALAIFKGSEIGYIFVVVFITFPYMAIGLLDGLRSADRELDGMAQIYRVGSLAHVRHVLAPFIAPYMFAALRNTHALAWKIIVAVEIFGAARSGFGIQFSNAWGYFLIVQVHLWLLVFMAVVFIAEYGLLRPAERIVFKWRD